MKSSLIFCTLLASVSVSAAEDSAAKTARPGVHIQDRWVFTMANLLSEDSLQKTIGLVERAKRAGYNGLLLADSKMAKFQLQDKRYEKNCRKLRQACTDNGVDLIVCVCPMGYAAEFMAVDPNLAEGMPVRKAPFVVRSGRLEPLLDSPPLVNGSLTEWKRGSPAGWTADKPGLLSFRDDQVTCQRRPTLRQDQSGARGGPARFYQPIQVRPWHYYHVSVMAKTKDCTSKDFRIFALGAGNYPLDWQPPPIKPTMDWTRLDATFASLDNTQVALYLGSWAPKGGTIWWSDVRLEPGGLVNVIRRPSLPLTVASEHGQTAYVEGRDFSQVQDPKLGHDPNPGYFSYWHQPPVVAIPSGSRLVEGQRVLAGYHFATLVGKSHQITCCLSEPKVYELIEAQIRWVKEVVRPDSYLMAHDEIRHGGWDDSCARRHLTCGQLLADNVRRCVQIIRRIDPGKPIAAWNDMFDPYHNAQRQGPMYLAKGDGPWAGSWEGLPASVTIATWAQNNADSLRFFAERGHGQILAGYYDADPRRIVAWLKLADEVRGVRGVIYTTWVGDYSKLESFMDNVRQFERQ